MYLTGESNGKKEMPTIIIKQRLFSTYSEK
jgi:hypothetical protein